MSRSKLFFDIFGDDKSGPAWESVSGRLTRFEDRMKAAGRRMQVFGAGMSVAITAPLALAAKDMVGLFNEQDAAMTQVRAAVESTGGGAGKTADELFDMATKLQDLTTFGDEEILKGVTAQLLTFTNVTEETFEKAQAAVLDFATAQERDLQSASIMLGKALNDPIKGLSALGEAGTQFTEDQKKLIEAMVEAGDIAGAQKVILDELAVQYGGQASAAAETFAGQAVQLSNAWGDVKEEFGAILVEILPPLVDLLGSLVDWLGDLSPDTKKWALVVGGLTAVLGPVVAAVGLFVTGIAAIGAPVMAAIAAIGAIAGAAYFFWEDIVAAKDAVVDFATEMIDRVAALPEQIVAAFAGIADRMMEVGREIMSGLWSGLKGKFGEVKDGITGFAGGLVDGVKTRLGIESPSKVFAEIGRNIMEGLGVGLDAVAPNVEDRMSSIAQDLSGEVKGLLDGVLRQGQSFRGALANLFGNLGNSFLSTGIDAFVGSIFPGFANGTQFAPGGLAMVGERGPELVRLPRGSQVYPAETTRRMTRDGGAGGVVVNLSVDARYAQEGVAEQIRRELAGFVPQLSRAAVAAVQDARRRGVAV